MWLLLLSAAPQVPDEVDPPAEDLPTVRANVGLLGGRSLHLVPGLSATPVGGGETAWLFCGAPWFICTVGAVLGVLVPRAGQDDLDGHLLI